MDKETIKAIKASIAHWKRMRKDIRSEAPTSSQCPLCELFYDIDCDGCPVAAKTGKPFCDKSPYHAAAMMWEKARLDISYLPYWKSLADEEIEFLQSLLPPKTTTKTKTIRRK